MGARERLIEAAKQCLVERGWGATTVRDVAAAAGANHAAIGYHFGSREALLTLALVEAVEDLDRELRARTADGTPEERWTALLGTFRSHRALWVAQIEAVAQAHRSAEVRERLQDGQRRGLEGLGGPVPLAVLVGLAVQSLVADDDSTDGTAGEYAGGENGIPDAAAVLAALGGQA